MQLPAKMVLLCLHGYKRLISPFLPPLCRFTPTCSEYAAEAVCRFGVCKGMALAVWRILRCQPFSAGGYDPVPPDKPERSSETLDADHE